MQPITTVIPFKLEGAKSRLSSVLNSGDRRLLALTMLEDVAEAVLGLGEVLILSRGPLPKNVLSVRSTKIIECDAELDPALNWMIENWGRKGWPSDLLIAMADLPLIGARDLEDLVGTRGDVVISPGRGGGTNLILIRNPQFRVSYYGLSFLKHLKIARDLGLEPCVYESYRCGCDIDEPSDLVEALIHGKGRTPKLLREMGFDFNGEGEKLRVKCLRETR